jgi:hypothetical protein
VARRVQLEVEGKVLALGLVEADFGLPDLAAGAL